MRIDLPDLHIFARVAEAQSFREASAQLRMARSSVSKRIGEIEKNLGVTLFNRSTRRISLTDAGHTLYQQWKSISRDIENALESVQGLDQVPTGILRVSLPSSFGAALMPDIVQRFLSQWPDLRMSIDFREALVDVVGSGFDIVIRFAPRLPDSRLTARRLATTRCVLAASPQYIARHGRPRYLRELKQHHCLGLGYRAERKMSWAFGGETGPTETVLEPAFAANNDLALVLAACLGAGILYSPKLLIESELRLGRLEVIELEDVAALDYGVFAVYPQPKPPAKVRVFVDFVQSALERLGETDRWAPLRESRASLTC